MQSGTGTDQKKPEEEYQLQRLGEVHRKEELQEKEGFCHVR